MLTISPLSNQLNQALQQKIDTKTKPPGSLGDLEQIALQIGRIQNRLDPSFQKPTMLVFAADHGIAQSGVSPYPQSVTYQMVLNFLNGGAAINVFAKANGLDLKVVDAGVIGAFQSHPTLIDRKVREGTRNYLHQPAMTHEECETALKHGVDLAYNLSGSGSNLIGFGEMGIANTSSAALLMHLITGDPLSQCVGRGTGLDDAGLAKKQELLSKALETHGTVTDPSDMLRIFGGYEIAMMAGAMLGAAQKRMTLLIDGFITTSALLIAHAMQPSILDYCIFSHCSQERGHTRMLEFLNRKPLLQLGLRLGEGTGAALAWPLVRAASAFLNDMASFEQAGVDDRA